MIDPAPRLAAACALAGLVTACCQPPKADIAITEISVTGVHATFLAASTAPGERVTVTGILYFGAETAFDPDELRPAVESETKRRNGGAVPTFGWLFGRAKPLRELEIAETEVRRLGIEPDGWNLHVRLTGRFRYLSSHVSGFDREFVADGVDQIVICPKHPATYKGCYNYHRSTAT